MTNEETQEIREISKRLIKLLVRDNRKKAKRVEKDMKKYPERYSEDFLREAGYSAEETKRLLAERKSRLEK